MSNIHVCLQHKQKRYLGGLHYNLLDFSLDLQRVEEMSDQSGIISDKLERRLIPLTENNMERMATYLIEMLSSDYHPEKPTILVNFNTQKMLVHEAGAKIFENYRECSGEILTYKAVDQQTLEEAILNPSKLL